MLIKPAPGYILVKFKESKKKLDSGIYLPDSHDEKSQVADVVAIGAGTTNDPQPCKKNDTIIYKKWGGNEVKLQIIDKNPLLFIEFKDVLAIVEGKYV